MAKAPARQQHKPAQHKRSVVRLIPRHGAFPIAAIAGVIGYIAAQLFLPDAAIGVAANAWFGVYLAVVLFDLPKLTPDELKKHADQDAPPIGVIMLVTLAVVAIAAFSLFSALNSGGQMNAEQVVLGVLSVALGWLVVHTMAGLHYAYEFYEAPNDGKGGKEMDNISGGLQWPEGEPPDGSAFLYLSCQIGAALQVADTPVTTNKMRRLILAHTVFSFFYNTMLVAATINVVVQVAGG